LYSWEAFQGDGVPQVKHPEYLSEAKVGTVDAAFSRINQCQGVLPSNTALRALSNLALGRSSVFFHWRAEKMKFEQSVEQVALSGMSLECSNSLISWMIQYSTKLRVLQLWIDTQDSGDRVLASVTALKRAAARTLQAIEATVSASVPDVTSLLQLQHVLGRPFDLISCIEKMRASIENCATEEQAISAMSLCVQSSADSGSELTGAMRDLLALACAPWLEALANGLGISTSTNRDCSHLSLCLAAELDQEGDLSAIDDEYRMSNSGPLLSKEDLELVKEIRANLKLLRKYLPDHKILLSGDGSPNTRGNRNPVATQSAEPFSFNPWAIQNQEELAHLSFQCMSEPPAAQPLVHEDSFAATLHFLQSDTLASKSAYQFEILPALRINPFDKIRLQIEAQSRHLNQLFIRHLFQNCNLGKHLELQYMFHLFGNGEFVVRLSTALFSLETQTAQRTRGKLPTSQPLGLQLGAEGIKRWPPASSELRLTLNGLLNESYHHTNTCYNRSGSSRVDIPGGLSFSIRELEDNDIERVMDASSIYALDFLRLQYKTPAPLDVVLTPPSMKKYDEVFRFMLRIIRILDATTRLQSRTLAEDGKIHLATRRFAVQLHCFMTSLTSCLFDIAIKVPWKKLKCAVTDIESCLARPESSNGLISITALRDLHEECLDRIRSRLFLKQKQEKLRKALESLLITVLDAAGALQLKDKAQATVVSLIATFETAIKTFL
ncbi:hypothetical protein M433DRAFT_32297, partial [Acidomyces richmondensis BFW]